MGQHHPAHWPPGHADIGGLYRDAQGVGKVVKVPIVGVTFAIAEAQQRCVRLGGVEQVGIVQAENRPDQQP
ncbi:hypothetical protein D9M71_835690 [compost metagenome]